MFILAAFNLDSFSLRARIIPLKVAATSVKLAMPPPIMRALLRPSGSAVAQSRTTRAYCKTSSSFGAPLYSA
nr:hypothetical protein RF11_02490 [Ipomoea batatas]